MFWSSRHEYQPVATTTDDGTASSSSQLGESGSPLRSASGTASPSSSGPPKAQQWVVVLIAVVGGLALAMSLAADVMRVKQSASHMLDAQNDLHCVYPSSPSGGYAVAAAFLLIVAQGVTLVHGGTSWFYASRLDTRRNRNLLLVVLLTNLIFLAVTIVTLSVSSLDNAHPGTYTLRSSSSSSALSPNQSPDPCPVADSALFLSASLLCLFTVLLMEAYYLAAMRTLQYAWMISRYCTVRSVHLEAFQREAMRASVVPIGSPRSDLESGEEIKEA
ncbi:hypothetical protein CLOM_g16458 [Closterium sp. NIES-68]|nr:hypothetical protein CLOM_g16458 [Closterium sp. NIES-68]GJP58217.1 hypothetical protein CLOP_g22686 [Closterium sp. NIES-67]